MATDAANALKNKIKILYSYDIIHIQNNIYNIHGSLHTNT